MVPGVLETAISQTLAYADVFDFPLTAGEIHRYLVGLGATLEAVQAGLAQSSPQDGWVRLDEDLYSLPGRAALGSVRRAREQHSARLWPQALLYGARVAHLPFVRMVAVTGSLAVDSIEGRGDIDYFIVTSPGRLWTCRALLVLLVRAPAAISGFRLCFNYLVTCTEQGLTFPERNLYTAHEVAQMVPLAGLDVYEEMREKNPWVLEYLPNAGGPPARALQMGPLPGIPREKVLERALAWPNFDQLESFEMRRKIGRLSRRGPSDEASFSADWCKGHFDGHEARTLRALRERLAHDD